jgi:hypothetical protein
VVGRLLASALPAVRELGLALITAMLDSDTHASAVCEEQLFVRVCTTVQSDACCAARLRALRFLRRCLGAHPRAEFAMS